MEAQNSGQEDKWKMPFSLRLDAFIARINRFHDEGYCKWKIIDVSAHYIKKEEIMPYLNTWESKGYIKIIDNGSYLFEVLNPISK